MGHALRRTATAWAGDPDAEGPAVTIQFRHLQKAHYDHPVEVSMSGAREVLQ